MSRRKTLEEWVVEVKAVHGDKFDYSESQYKGCKTDIAIRCRKHNYIFPQRPDVHRIGGVCPLCAQEARNEKRTKTTGEWIKDAVKVHGDKYGYDKVVYVNAYTDIEIYCKVHKRYFPQQPTNHIHNGAGCPWCSGNACAMTLEKFIESAKEVHGDKYSYHLVDFINMTKEVDIYCNIHTKSFHQRPERHLAGAGCPWCSGNAKLTTEEFIERSKEIFGEEHFDYTKTIYCGSKVDVIIRCRHHDVEYKATPGTHYISYGCPDCSSIYYGFQRTKRGVLYSIKLPDNLYKIGITNKSVKVRYLKKDQEIFEQIIEIPLSGEEAYTAELYLKRKYSEYAYKGEGVLSNGNTEIFHVDVFKEENLPEQINELVETLNLK